MTDMTRKTGDGITRSAEKKDDRSQTRSILQSNQSKRPSKPFDLSEAYPSGKREEHDGALWSTCNDQRIVESTMEERRKT